MPLICHLAMSQRPYVLSRDENSSSFQWLGLFDSLNHLVNAVLCICMSFFTFCDHINDSNRVYFTDSSTELYSHCNLKYLVTPCKKKCSQYYNGYYGYVTFWLSFQWVDSIDSSDQQESTHSAPKRFINNSFLIHWNPLMNHFTRIHIADSQTNDSLFTLITWSHVVKCFPVTKVTFWFYYTGRETASLVLFRKTGRKLKKKKRADESCIRIGSQSRLTYMIHVCPLFLANYKRLGHAARHSTLM